MAKVTLRNVEGLDLTIGDREFVVLTGPAPNDVSPIVRLIAGLADVSQGEILFDERRVNDVPPKDRDVAFLSDDYAPYPDLSVRENLALGLRRRKFAEGEITKRIRAVAEILGLQEGLQKKGKSLSPEERPLVGLACAMVRQPRVYLFNDPFGRLGAAAATRGRAEIVKLHQRSSATTIYATSNPAEALALATRTIVLRAGAIQQDASAPAIYAAPANLFVAQFFGNPPMNLVHGTIKIERGAAVFVEAGEGTISVNLPGEDFPEVSDRAGQPVVLGFRPEALEVADAGSGGGAIFRALIERAEPRGSGADLYLRTGAHELICRTHQWRVQDQGAHRSQFRITLEEVHFFDPASGLRVTRQP